MNLPNVQPPSLPETDKAILAEFLARTEAESSFVRFNEYVDPDQPPAQHHRMLCEALQDVAEGRLKRLMVLMPPGSAKSTYATVRFPAWYLGRNRKHGVITASYNDDLAGSFGRKVRNLVGSDKYAGVFDLGLSADSRGRGEWETADGGFYFAVGVGGGVTGRRADLIVADDLIRGVQDADSETVRNKTWEWWSADLRTRGKPGYALVLINTRWHEDDVSGRILPEDYAGESGWITSRDGERWMVICLPAQAGENDALGRKPGEWLWPEWFTEDHWSLTRKVTPTRQWFSLYQQTPTAEDGDYFRREWFRRYDTAPSGLVAYLSCDFAITEGGGDYTEIAVWGVDTQRRIFALDWWHGQTNALDWSEQIIRLCKLHKPAALIGEGDNIRKAVLPFLRRMMQDTGVYVMVEELPAGGADKAAKARNFQAIQQNGLVYWPKVEWAERVISQCVKFPAGKHDDAVDTCGVFGRYIDKVWQAPMPKAPPTNLETAWNAPLSIGDLRSRIAR
jgi:predicted phage terminase large subunit-like protein